MDRLQKCSKSAHICNRVAHHDNNGWWYADTQHNYYRSCWQTINHHRYYFNEDGYALTDWHQIDGKWYYFEPTAGHPLECALYVTDADGAQETRGVLNQKKEKRLLSNRQSLLL